MDESSTNFDFLEFLFYWLVMTGPNSRVRYFSIVLRNRKEAVAGGGGRTLGQ